LNLIELWQFQFFRNALAASVLCGAGCSVIGVFIVTMRIPFIGVAMSHAAMAGAVFGLLTGLSPAWCGFALALAASLAVGPLTDRVRMDPNISLGVIFSLMMGLAFLGIGLSPTPRSDMLGLIWGNILLISTDDIRRLAVVTGLGLSLVFLFYKEFRAVMFSRLVAAASGVRERFAWYLLLVLCGATITVNLDTVGGLMLFSMIVNPAAAAWQFTYRMNRLFLLSALFGVLSAVCGMLVSSLFNLPSGACVVVASSALFAVSLLFSPKRRHAGNGSVW
jgi:manganese/iron transport system permease protein